MKDKKPDELATEAPATDNPLPEPETAPKPAAGENHWQRFKSWYTVHKRLSIPLTILFLALILAAVPFTRYAIAGTVKKDNVELKVTDATADTPVSGATVSIGGISAETDSAGLATLRGVKAGNHNAVISKKYYRPQTISLLAPIFSQKTVPEFTLAATGRQVKIDVTNLIDKTVLANVDIKAAGITAKTDKSGSATIVLPVGQATQQASLSLPGYNDAKVTIKVSNDRIQENQFGLTPTGKVYFLSNLSGNIDVVKTNLDGTDRQTVLAGTGNEDGRNTVLLASRDWKYLALLSRRAGNTPTLYLINTANDNVTTIDSGSAAFNLVGWAGDSFVYEVNRNNIAGWQPHQQALKSFNALNNKLTILDQTDAQGTNLDNYASESYGDEYIVGNSVVFDKTWNYSYSFLYSKAPDITTKYAGIYSVDVNGSSVQKLQTFNYKSYGANIYLNDEPYSPTTIYFQEIYYNPSGSSSTAYFEYADARVLEADNLASNFNNYQENPQPTYLLSPSGNQTFWSEPRDGKNTLFTGDQNGQNPKQIGTLSDYAPYGWYTDNYLLVAKDSSELYIMAKDGSEPAVKISDYYKPAVILNGYGGGYGGA